MKTVFMVSLLSHVCNIVAAELFNCNIVVLKLCNCSGLVVKFIPQ